MKDCQTFLCKHLLLDLVLHLFLVEAKTSRRQNLRGEYAYRASACQVVAFAVLQLAAVERIVAVGRQFQAFARSYPIYSATLAPFYHLVGQAARCNLVPVDQKGYL